MNEEILNRLKSDCDVLQLKMDKALNDDNIGTYNNLQKALVNNINAMSVIIKHADECEQLLSGISKSYVFENMFKDCYSTSENKAIFYTTDSIRSVGKTYFLKKLAIHNDGILVVQRPMVESIKKENPTLTVVSSIKQGMDLRIRPVYVDEGVSEDVVEYVKNNAKNYFIFKRLVKN